MTKWFIYDKLKHQNSTMNGFVEMGSVEWCMWCNRYKICVAVGAMEDGQELTWFDCRMIVGVTKMGHFISDIATT